MTENGTSLDVSVQQVEIRMAKSPRALSLNVLDLHISGLMAASVAAVAMVSGTASADSHDPVTISHGYSTFGELKYDADFERLDYVNPDAPKGGEILSLIHI